MEHDLLHAMLMDTWVVSGAMVALSRYSLVHAYSRARAHTYTKKYGKQSRLYLCVSRGYIKMSYAMNKMVIVISIQPTTYE